MRGRFTSGAGRIALCGVLIAVSTVLLYLAGSIPSGKMGVTAAAGLSPLLAVLVSGRPAGLMCWAGSGLLGLLIAPEKWLSLLYISFFGLYPVVKSVLEGRRSRAVEWVCKLVYFNAVLAAVLFFYRELFLSGLPEVFHHDFVLALAGNAVFVVYDVGLSKLIGLFLSRLAPLWRLKP